MIDMELDRLKAHPFPAYAESFGYQRVAGETGNSYTLKNDDGDKLVAKQDGDHWVYFSVKDRADNGSVLDFVQRRIGGSLGHVRKLLRDMAGQTGTWRDISLPTARSLDRDDTHKPAIDPYRKTAAVWNAATWNPAPDYLLSRDLSAAVLSDPMFTDCWRVDRHGNVLFPHHDQGGMCGYERRGPDCKSFGKDVKRGVWRSANLWHDLTTEIVICEAPIDCLSHYQLTGGSLAYIATGGSLGSRQLELLRLLFKRVIRSEGVWVTVGTDNDPAGDAMYDQIAAIAPMKVYRSAAVGKDWNDDLAWLSREAA